MSGDCPTISGPDLDAAQRQFHDALTAYGKHPAGRQLGHGRDGEYVDDNSAAVVEALLLAGWQPPDRLPSEVEKRWAR